MITYFPLWDYLCSKVDMAKKQLRLYLHNQVDANLITVSTLDISKVYEPQTGLPPLHCLIDNSPCAITLSQPLRNNGDNIVIVNLCTLTGAYSTSVTAKDQIKGAAVSRKPLKMMYKDRYGASLTKLTLALIVYTITTARLVLLTFEDALDNLTVARVETLEHNNLVPASAVISAIHILEADHKSTRMCHTDPRILLGFSTGQLLMYRLRTKVYTHNAPRVRDPVNLSEFVQFANKPVNHISCSRTSSDHKLLVSIAQNSTELINQSNTEASNTHAYAQLIEVHADTTATSLGTILPFACTALSSTSADESPFSEDNNSYLTTTAKEEIISVKFAPTSTTPSLSTLTHLYMITESRSTYYLDIWDVRFDNNKELVISKDNARFTHQSRLFIAKEKCYEVIHNELNNRNQNFNATLIDREEIKGLILSSNYDLLYNAIFKSYNAAEDKDQLIIKNYSCLVHYPTVVEDNKKRRSRASKHPRITKRLKNNDGNSSPTSSAIEMDDTTFSSLRISPLPTSLLSSPSGLIGNVPVSEEQQRLVEQSSSFVETESCNTYREDVNMEDTYCLQVETTKEAIELTAQHEQTIDCSTDCDVGDLEVTYNNVMSEHITADIDCSFQSEEVQEYNSYSDAEDMPDTNCISKKYLAEEVPFGAVESEDADNSDDEFFDALDLEFAAPSSDTPKMYDAEITSGDEIHTTLDEATDNAPDNAPDIVASTSMECNHAEDENLDVDMSIDDTNSNSSLVTLASPSIFPAVTITEEASNNANDSNSVGTEPDGFLLHNVDEQQVFLRTFLKEFTGEGPTDVEKMTDDELRNLGDWCWNDTRPELKLFMLRKLYDRIHPEHDPRHPTLQSPVLAEIQTKIMYLCRSLLTTPHTSLSEMQRDYVRKKYMELLNRVHPSVAYGGILNPFANNFREEQLKERAKHLREVWNCAGTLTHN